MIPVRFRPAASEDLVVAVSWYEKQQPGLGRLFFDDFDRVLLRIEEFREQFPKVYRDIRRALLRRFPFGIFFRVYDDQTVIIAIADLRRKPARWRRRR